MKRIIKLTSIAAITAAFAGAVAFADDGNLQQQLALQRAQDHRSGVEPTIAVYSNRKGISHAKNQARPGLRFEMHYNPNGEAFGLYVPAE